MININYFHIKVKVSMSRREITWYENDMLKDIYKLKKFIFKKSNQIKYLDNKINQKCEDYVKKRRCMV